MNVIKVIIENWPKKELLLEWGPLIISGIALIVSLIFNFVISERSRKQFLLSNRPYVYLVPIKEEPGNLRIFCKNRPAAITKEVYSYTVVISRDKEQNEERLLFTHQGPKDKSSYLVYPDDVAIERFRMGYDFSAELKKPETKKILRKARIEYKALSTKDIYFFEAEWKFDTQTKDWDVTKQTGN